jgi:hypothetical protein
MDRIDGRVNRRISGQRFHIAGSADRSVSPARLQYARELVAGLTASLVSNGGRMVIQLGEEPHLQGTRLSTLFDWTVLEQVVKVAAKEVIPNKSFKENPCLAVGFSDWKIRIPNSRFDLVQKAVDAGVLEIAQLPRRLHIGAVMRERQAFYGDILVTMGGGPGVEHLAELYRQRHQPVIPLDLDLKPGRESASERLNIEAMEKPFDFFEYAQPRRATAALSSLSVKRKPKAGDFVARFLAFVTSLKAPRVFFARMLNKRVPNYQEVMAFFDKVVSQTMTESGFSRFDPGSDASVEPFLNVEIFKMIQASSIVVADLTGLRPNCICELGYALGLGKRIIVTAIQGTQLPFDTAALPCHFWHPKTPNGQRSKDFLNFVALNLNRRKIE